MFRNPFKDKSKPPTLDRSMSSPQATLPPSSPPPVQSLSLNRQVSTPALRTRNLTQQSRPTSVYSNFSTASEDGIPPILTTSLEPLPLKEAITAPFPTSTKASIQKAVIKNDIKGLKSLVTKKREKLNKLDTNGRAAIHFAGSRGALECLDILFSVGQDEITSPPGPTSTNEKTPVVDVDLLDIDGRTGLIHATINRHLNCVRQLLVHGASIDIVDKFGYTALHYSIANNDVPLVTVILSSRPNLAFYDTLNGQSYLHHAIEMNHTSVAMTLINRGFNVNMTDRHGRTALHLAVILNIEALAFVLIDKGANPSWKDDAGKLARDYATSNPELFSRLTKSAAINEQSIPEEDEINSDFKPTIQNRSRLENRQMSGGNSRDFDYSDLNSEFDSDEDSSIVPISETDSENLLNMWGLNTRNSTTKMNNLKDTNPITTTKSTQAAHRKMSHNDSQSSRSLESSHVLELPIQSVTKLVASESPSFATLQLLPNINGEKDTSPNMPKQSYNNNTKALVEASNAVQSTNPGIKQSSTKQSSKDFDLSAVGPLSSLLPTEGDKSYTSPSTHPRTQLSNSTSKSGNFSQILPVTSSPEASAIVSDASIISPSENSLASYLQASKSDSLLSHRITELQSEMEKLKSSLDLKNAEIKDLKETAEQQVQENRKLSAEKEQQKEDLNKEIMDLKATIADQRNQIKLVEGKHRDQIESLNAELRQWEVRYNDASDSSNKTQSLSVGEIALLTQRLQTAGVKIENQELKIRELEELLNREQRERLQLEDENCYFKRQKLGEINRLLDTLNDVDLKNRELYTSLRSSDDLAIKSRITSVQSLLDDERNIRNQYEQLASKELKKLETELTHLQKLNGTLQSRIHELESDRVKLAAAHSTLQTENETTIAALRSELSDMNAAHIQKLSELTSQFDESQKQKNKLDSDLESERSEKRRLMEDFKFENAKLIHQIELLHERINLDKTILESKQQQIDALSNQLTQLLHNNSQNLPSPTSPDRSTSKDFVPIEKYKEVKEKSRNASEKAAMLANRLELLQQELTLRESALESQLSKVEELSISNNTLKQELSQKEAALCRYEKLESTCKDLEREVQLKQEEISVISAKNETTEKKYSEVEATLTSNKVELLRIREELETAKVQHQKEISSYMEQRNELDKRLKEALSDNAESNERLKILESKLQQSESEFKRLVEESATLKKTITELELEKARAQARVEYLEAKLAQQSAISAEFESKYIESKESIGKAKNRITELEETLELCERNINKVRQERHELNRSIEKLEISVREKNAILGEQNIKIQIADKNIQNLKGEVGDLKKMSEEKSEKIAQLRDENVELDNEIRSCKKLVRNREEEIEVKEKEIQKLRNEKEEERSNYAKLKRELAKSKSTVNNDDDSKLRIQTLTQEKLELQRIVKTLEENLELLKNKKKVEDVEDKSKNGSEVAMLRQKQDRLKRLLLNERTRVIGLMKEIDTLRNQSQNARPKSVKDDEPLESTDEEDEDVLTDELDDISIISRFSSKRSPMKRRSLSTSSRSGERQRETIENNDHLSEGSNNTKTRSRQPSVSDLGLNILMRQIESLRQEVRRDRSNSINTPPIQSRGSFYDASASLTAEKESISTQDTGSTIRADETFQRTNHANATTNLGIAELRTSDNNHSSISAQHPPQSSRSSFYVADSLSSSRSSLSNRSTILELDNLRSNNSLLFSRLKAMSTRVNSLDQSYSKITTDILSNSLNQK